MTEPPPPQPPHPVADQPPQWDPRRDDPGGAHQVRWGIGETFAVFVVAFLVTGTAVVALGGAPAGVAAGLLLPVSVGLPLLITLTWVGLLRRGIGDLLGPRRRPSLRDVGYGVVVGIGTVVVINFGLGILLQVLAESVGAELPPVQETLRETANDPDLRLYFLLSTVVLAPLAEEVFYRGMLFQALRQRLWRWPAIGISGLLFGIVHLEPLAIVLTFGAGMCFAWAFARRGNLVVPIIAHAIFNLVGSLSIILGFG